MKSFARATVLTTLLLTFHIGASAAESTKAAVKSATKPALRTPAKPEPARTRKQVEDDAIIRNVDLINFAHRRLEFLRGDEIDCPQCLASSVGTGSSSLDVKDSAKVCKDKWLDFYAKDTIDVRIVFGYQDSDDDNLAGDVLQRQAMVDRITAKCAPDNLVQACGFKRSETDADLFERNVRGPDAKMHKMQVRVVASSHSASDAVNRAFSVEQEAATAKATQEFYDGMKKSDMLLYVGHARGGGGPDFAPAKRNAKGKIDYDYYRALTPGVDRLTRELMELDKTPKLLGFFACESESWHERLERLAPDSGLMLSATPKMPLEVGAAQAFAALDSAIWQRCETSFNKALNFNPEPGEDMTYGKTKLLPVSLKRFYK